jgi:hypothetical protein
VNGILKLEPMVQFSTYVHATSIAISPLTVPVPRPFRLNLFWIASSSDRLRFLGCPLSNIPTPASERINNFRRYGGCNWHPNENEGFMDSIGKRELCSKT